MSVPKLSLKMGLTRVTKSKWPSEPGFVQSMNDQLRAVTEDLNSAFAQFGDVTPQIMMDALQPTFEKSQEWVPQKTGALKASGYLEITGTGARPRVEMGYAKGGIPRYAVYVHEMVEYRHAPPTRSKFLEAALNEDQSAIFDRIADGYAKFMGK